MHIYAHFIQQVDFKSSFTNLTNEHIFQKVYDSDLT